MEWLGVDRRRLGTGMLVFGLAGMVMAGVVAVALVLGAFAARDLDDRLQADQARIAGSLTRLSVTMESLALTTQNASTTLETSAGTVAEAQVVLQATADALVAMSQALDVEILGSRPFGTASQKLADLALTMNGFQGKAQTLALNLHQNSVDASVMADQVRQLKDDVADLAARVTSFERIGDLVALLVGGIALGGLLTGWVALGAAFCAWAGWRLRRIADSDRGSA
jgi:hypothetical protein